MVLAEMARIRRSRVKMLRIDFMGRRYGVRVVDHYLGDLASSVVAVLTKSDNRAILSGKSLRCRLWIAQKMIVQ